MRVISRIVPLDWIVSAILLTLMSLDAIGVIAFGFGPATLFLVLMTSLILLGFVLWSGTLHNRGIKFGWMESTLLIGAILVSTAGFVGVVGGLGFSGIVALGYLLTFAGIYAIYRMEFPVRTAKSSPAPAEQIADKSPITPHELHEIDIFKDVPLADLKDVADLAQRLRVPCGTTLVDAALPASQLFLIFEGQIELYIRSPVGDNTVRIAGLGESLPLASLVGSKQLITCARAMTDAHLASIPSASMRRLCAIRPDIGNKVYASIAGILAERYRLTLGRLSATAREALSKAEFWANV